MADDRDAVTESDRTASGGQARRSRSGDPDVSDDREMVETTPVTIERMLDDDDEDA